MNDDMKGFLVKYPTCIALQVHYLRRHVMKGCRPRSGQLAPGIDEKHGFLTHPTEKLLINWVFLGKGDGLSFQLNAFLQATFKTPNQFIHQLLIQILQEVIDFLLKFLFRVKTINSDR